jgi:hypothetical protein
MLLPCPRTWGNLGSSVSSGGQPKSCLGWVFNSRLGCFVHCFVLPAKVCPWTVITFATEAGVFANWNNKITPVRIQLRRDKNKWEKSLVCKPSARWHHLPRYKLVRSLLRAKNKSQKRTCLYRGYYWHLANVGATLSFIFTIFFWRENKHTNKF